MRVRRRWLRIGCICMFRGCCILVSLGILSVIFFDNDHFRRLHRQPHPLQHSLSPFPPRFPRRRNVPQLLREHRSHSARCAQQWRRDRKAKIRIRVRLRKNENDISPTSPRLRQLAHGAASPANRHSNAGRHQPQPTTPVRALFRSRRIRDQRQRVRRPLAVASIKVAARRQRTR